MKFRVMYNYEKLLKTLTSVWRIRIRENHIQVILPDPDPNFISSDPADMYRDETLKNFMSKICKNSKRYGTFFN